MDEFNVVDKVSVDRVAETAEQISTLEKMETLCRIIGKVP